MFKDEVQTRNMMYVIMSSSSFLIIFIILAYVKRIKTQKSQSSIISSTVTTNSNQSSSNNSSSTQDASQTDNDSQNQLEMHIGHMRKFNPILEDDANHINVGAKLIAYQSTNDTTSLMHHHLLTNQHNENFNDCLECPSKQTKPFGQIGIDATIMKATRNNRAINNNRFYHTDDQMLTSNAQCTTAQGFHTIGHRHPMTMKTRSSRQGKGNYITLMDHHIHPLDVFIQTDHDITASITQWNNKNKDCISCDCQNTTTTNINNNNIEFNDDKNHASIHRCHNDNTNKKHVIFDDISPTGRMDELLELQNCEHKEVSAGMVRDETCLIDSLVSNNNNSLPLHQIPQVSPSSNCTTSTVSMINNMIDDVTLLQSTATTTTNRKSAMMRICNGHHHMYSSSFDQNSHDSSITPMTTSCETPEFNRTNNINIMDTLKNETLFDRDSVCYLNNNSNNNNDKNRC